MLESEGNQQIDTDKYNRVDLLARTGDDERIIVEVQYLPEKAYLKRLVYGAAKTIVENIELGEPYEHVTNGTSKHAGVLSPTCVSQNRQLSAKGVLRAEPPRNNTWARKGRVGKWGESTPSRQRGGSGASLCLTQYMFAKMTITGPKSMPRVCAHRPEA
uniref:PD-(D/E)XK nuclease family transposase n=1 Tax=Candidatus Kentrum sp. LPFa TaxID=2126335 RepID=A0A450WRN9_9GAMM|nr:MAG: PD-(D/E)XK nuclease family transposase [Candidatus Kentron sp. LPFa]VFK33619.1 MAG: PD-(D/E)XK nuclease family transposase [Candidatus Kentron sp. LPFa]